MAAIQPSFHGLGLYTLPPPDYWSKDSRTHICITLCHWRWARGHVYNTRQTTAQVMP